jgi:hypothetical protein
MLCKAKVEVFSAFLHLLYDGERVRIISRYGRSWHSAVLDPPSTTLLARPGILAMRRTYLLHSLFAGPTYWREKVTNLKTQKETSPTRFELARPKPTDA